MRHAPHADLADAACNAAGVNSNQMRVNRSCRFIVAAAGVHEIQQHVMLVWFVAVNARFGTVQHTHSYSKNTHTHSHTHAVPTTLKPTTSIGLKGVSMQAPQLVQNNPRKQPSTDSPNGCRGRPFHNTSNN